MIQTATLANGFTYVGVLDIIKLINVALGKRIVPESEYLFKKVCNKEFYFEKHYYCSKVNCMDYCGNLSRKDVKKWKCLKCENSEPEYFIYKPMANSIREIVKRNFEIIEEFRRKMRSSDCKIISDINTGEWYKSHSNVNNGDFLSININTDGVSPYNSSKNKSLWPILATLNDLPMKQRFRKENILVPGYWLSSAVGPKFDVFFKPFLKELDFLYNEGITIRHKNYKILVAACCLDSVARCKILEMKQYNGKYGCTYCYHPATGRNYQFMPDVEKRTFDKYKENYEELREKSENLQNKISDVKGVKGYSILTAIPGFDPMLQVPVDAMHCLFLGVTKNFLNLWFNSSNSTKPYYIKPNDRKSIDKKIKSIKIYSECTRRITSLENYANWKASEYFNWLFYYAKYCLSDFVIQPAYYQNFSQFVDCVEILYRNSISEENLNMVQTKLNDFVEQFENLYGVHNMLYNIHLITHLTNTVRLFGPLITTSLFVFENFNGVLGKFLTGPFAPLVQLSVRHFLFFSNYYGQRKKMSFDAIEYCKRTMHKNTIKYRFSNCNKSYKEFTLPSDINNTYSTNQQFKSYEKFYLRNKFIISTENCSKKSVNYNDSFIFLENNFYKIIKILQDIDETNDDIYILGEAILVLEFPGIQNYYEIRSCQGNFLIKLTHNLKKCVYIQQTGRSCLIKINNMLVND